MAAQGIEAIDLASTYHPIDALSPRGGSARLFTSARGAVHFPARAGRYGRIRPALSSPEVCGVWPQVATQAAALGLAVNAWTVMLYQPWIVDAYPDCGCVLPSGDRIGSGICPANEDVREYVAALCQDMVDQFGVSTLRLEGIMTGSYDYGWLRPRVLVDVSRLAGELLALCFCASCIRRATTAGLDAERLRRLVNDVIAAELTDGPAGTEQDRLAGLGGDTELMAFVVQHERAAVELAQIATSGLGPKVPRVSTMPRMPYSTLLGAVQNDLFEELVAAIDQFVVVRAQDAERVGRLRSTPSPEGPPLRFAILLTPPRSGAQAMIRSALAMMPPEQAAARERVANDLRAAAALGLEEVGIYNYGLLRERDFRDLVATIRSAFS
jgi:hypothetical protein